MNTTRTKTKKPAIWQRITKNPLGGPLLYLRYLSNLHQDLVQRLRFWEEGAVIAAFDLEHTFGWVLSDQLLLNIGRKGVVIQRLYVEAATGSILLCRQGDCLHHRSQWNRPHWNHSQSTILKQMTKIKTYFTNSELRLGKEIDRKKVLQRAEMSRMNTI